MTNKIKKNGQAKLNDWTRENCFLSTDEVGTYVLGYTWERTAEEQARHAAEMAEHLSDAGSRGEDGESVIREGGPQRVKIYFGETYRVINARCQGLGQYGQTVKGRAIIEEGGREVHVARIWMESV